MDWNKYTDGLSRHELERFYPMVVGAIRGLAEVYLTRGKKVMEISEIEQAFEDVRKTIKK